MFPCVRSLNCVREFEVEAKFFVSRGFGFNILMYPRETIRFSRFGVSRRAHGGTIDRRIVEVKSDRSMTDQRSRHSVEIEEMSLVGPLLSNTPGNCSSRSIHHLRKSSISRSLAVNLSVSSSSSSSSSSFFSFATIVGIEIGDWRERERYLVNAFFSYRSIFVRKKWR